ncbi:MAG: hypothetical protein N2651_03665 [Fimbriimonadales bacterium]|nr:hypothetical protein [Fimbriimonadales bacterium]
MSGSSSNATLILVFGILSLVLPCMGMPFGIVAWILGNTARRELDAGFGDPSLRSQVETGRILGIIGTILWGGCCLGYIALYLIVFLLAALGGSPNTF